MPVFHPRLHSVRKEHAVHPYGPALTRATPPAAALRLRRLTPRASAFPASDTTLSWGAQLANSLSQFLIVESGTTTRCGSSWCSAWRLARKAMVWGVKTPHRYQETVSEPREK